MTLEELKEMHDKAYQANQDTRERACDDLVFHWVTQWDDGILDETQLSYRGEFDILRKATRGILTDLDNNPVQNDFVPEDEDAEDSADFLDGMYRADTHHNLSVEAFVNGDTEAVVCGMGAWMLYTEYESLKNSSNNLVIRRKPIHEANSRVYFDPNDHTLDKSQAHYVSVLTPYSEHGYKELIEELTGEDSEGMEVNMESFKHPEISYTFPWIGGESKKIWITEFFYRELVEDTHVTFTDPLGSEMIVLGSELKDVEDQLIEDGYEQIAEKDIKRYQVTRYVASGEKIIAEEEIPGEHLPVIPVYGEYAVVEGEEHYEGVTRLAKDPQRLHNFQMSFLADIAARSPREKPIFYPEQVAGYEHMYSESGADNNYPYVLVNRTGRDGAPIPPMPIGTLPAPNVPQALVASLQLSRQAVEDVANAGVPEKMPDRDVSGRAISLLQTRIDMQSAVYQKNRKHARRRDGEVYASMAAYTYDVPRTVEVMAQDGTRKKVQTMDTVFDKTTNEFKVVRDLNNKEFKVYSKISASYASQKEETITQLGQMTQGLAPGDPLRNILMLKQLRLMDGVDFDDVRDYAKKQLLSMGVIKPETPEEEATVKQAQEAAAQPGADMVLAQAELVKGQAAMKASEVKMMQAQADTAVDQAKVQIDGFNAQTKRIDSQVKAQEAGADIEKTKTEALGNDLENQTKLMHLTKPENMTDEQLVASVFGA